jgi:hypothetical protein
MVAPWSAGQDMVERTCVTLRVFAAAAFAAPAAPAFLVLPTAVAPPAAAPAAPFASLFVSTMIYFFSFHP